MKTVSKTLIKFTAAFAAVVLSGTAFAEPVLQLDLEGGYYVDATETVVTDLEDFELYVVGTPDGRISETELLADTWWLAIALTPDPGGDSAPDIGSFTVGGVEYDVTDFTYGTPPLDAYDANGEQGLASHGIYDTWYMELRFRFGSESYCGTYNVQDNPGEYDGNGTGSFCEIFDINIANLDEGFNLHFDSYNTETRQNGPGSGVDEGVGIFAPFSHDGETNCCEREVPEPGTIGLLGIGLLGLGIARRRKSAV